MSDQRFPWLPSLVILGLTLVSWLCVFVGLMFVYANYGLLEDMSNSIMMMMMDLLRIGD